MKFKDIPQITQANYQIDVPVSSLQEQLDHYKKHHNLQLRPDFQRAHVWTEQQQSAYVEWLLRGGQSGRDILFNCKGWMNEFDGDMVLVDGLQRITAILRFLDNEITAFGVLYNDYEGTLPAFSPGLKFYVNDLPTRKEVLQWYLDINTGGTDHTAAEIERVQSLLEKENAHR